MILGVLLLLIGLLAAAGFFFSAVAVYPKVIPYAETCRREVEAGKIKLSEFEAWPKEEIWIDSPFGYRLHGFYFPMQASQKTVVIVHGITWSLYGSVKYMPIFRKRGYNILIYDHRMHGLSGGKNCTFGFFEKYDLKKVVDWAFSRLGPDGKVGTHGESLGGATVLQHSAIDPRLSFVIADCPFSDLEPLFAYRLKEEYHLPAFPLLKVASQACYLLTGMRFNKVRPIQDIRELVTPMLFCHGLKDGYIPPQMSIDLQRAKCVGISRLYLAPEAHHAEAYWNNQVEYDRIAGEFLTEIGL